MVQLADSAAGHALLHRCKPNLVMPLLLLPLSTLPLPPLLPPRRGCAEEVYYIIVPRHPAAPRALVSTGAQHGEAAKSAVPAAVALPTRRWTAGEASVVH